jgi:hypothetical protein
MALTKPEKKAFLIPALLTVILISTMGYNFSLLAELDELQARNMTMTGQLREDLLTVQTLESIRQKERDHLTFALDEWIPLVQNSLQLKLYLSERVKNALEAVGAVQKEWDLNPDDTNKPHLCRCYLEALFPSHAALVDFLKDIEEHAPPLLPQTADIRKDGFHIAVSLTLFFGYRLKDETI